MGSQSTAATMVDDVVRAVRRLPADRLPSVLQFVEFIEFQVAQGADDGSEDEALWVAVQANLQHQRSHPEEALEEYADGEAFLAGMSDR
jgi:hypothetical protein